jgi:predicted nucleic acid-binding protein
MILYMDSSAIVKEYVVEPGSVDVQTAVEQSIAIGTTAVSRAEVVAALCRAARMKIIARAECEAAIHSFGRRWRDLIRTRVTDRLVRHASELACTHGLRGYDSLQLASGIAWQQALGQKVTFATFDARLWQAARNSGLLVFPGSLSQTGFNSTVIS